jgi:hypothetical protein
MEVGGQIFRRIEQPQELLSAHARGQLATSFLNVSIRRVIAPEWPSPAPHIEGSKAA